MTAPRYPEIDGASPVAIEDASPPRSFLTGGASTLFIRFKCLVQDALIAAGGFLFRTGVRLRHPTGWHCPHCEIAKPCNFCAIMETQL